jgi:hypothetical protein
VSQKKIGPILIFFLILLQKIQFENFLCDAVLLNKKKKRILTWTLKGPSISDVRQREYYSICTGLTKEITLKLNGHAQLRREEQKGNKRTRRWFTQQNSTP